MLEPEANHGHGSTLAYSSAVGCQERYPRNPVGRQCFLADGATRYCRSLGAYALNSMFQAWRARGNTPGVVTGRLASVCAGDIRIELRSVLRLGSTKRSANAKKTPREQRDSHNSKSSSAATIAMNTYVETLMRREQLDSTDVSTNTSAQ